MATQSIDKPLAVAFTCPTTIEVGDVAVISTDLAVIKSNGIAQDEVVGTVIEHIDDATTCVVSTPFRQKTTRTAASTSPVGPFVWNTLNRVTPFVNAPFASVTGSVAAPWVVIKNILTGSVAETFAIAKATITGSNPQTFAIAKATITGTQAETFAIVQGVSDLFKVSVNGGAAQTFTLTAGATKSAADVAGDFSAATGFAASAATGHLVLTATTAGQSLEIVTVATNAYTLLGFSVSSSPVYGNDQFKISVNGAAAQTFNLTAGAARTAANIVSDFSGASGFVASANGNNHVVLTATTAGHGLEIVTVNGNAYTTLGFTVAAAVFGNDQFKISINGGAPQTLSLTVGAARTAAEVASDLSGTGFVASASTGHVVLTPSNAGHSIQIVAVDGSAYATLGFSVATVTPNCMFKFKVGTGNSQTVTFATAGSRTAAQIVSEFSAVTDVTVSATAANKIKFTVDDVGTDFEIEAITGSAYTLLGFTAAVTDVNPDSHSAAAVGGVIICGPEPMSVTSSLAGPYLVANGTTDAFKITVGSNATETFDLTAGPARTATQIVADLNATAAAFTAEVTYLGQVKIIANSAWQDIVIESVTNDAYTALGFAKGTYAASKTVTTLEY